MCGKSPEEKAGEVLYFLRGAAFKFYYEKFSRDGNLTEDAADWQTVKKEIYDRVIPIIRPEENISRAMAVQLDPADLLSSLFRMKTIFENAGFKNEAKFGLLRNVVMEHVDVAQFAMYPSRTTFEDLTKTI